MPSLKYMKPGPVSPRVPLLLLLLLLGVTASAKRRAPLAGTEMVQLSEAPEDSLKRLQLYIKFAELRLTAINLMRNDPKLAEGRGRKIHDLLEDFTVILDEINNSMDQSQGRPLRPEARNDFRKGLSEVLKAGAQWGIVLKDLKAAAGASAEARQEAADFQFTLLDAQDALKSTMDTAREYAEGKDTAAPSPK